MNQLLRFSLAVLAAFTLSASYSQTTLISDNTNLTIGFILPNGIPVLQNPAGQLYTTNGTTASLITSDVTHVDSASAVVYKDKLYFTGESADNDVELWVTDGTGAGTMLVQDVATSGSSTPSGLFVFNNFLYFTADDGTNGRELWRSDGTANNASIVSNIDGAATSSISESASFFQNGTNVFFAATNNNKLGLYKLTSSGVSMVKESLGDEILLDANVYAANIGGKTVFTVRKGTDILTGSSELWVTDGTTAGTTMLKNFGIGSYSMFAGFVLFNGFLYFDGFDLTGTGIELWRTDGTAANTKLFKDIDPAAGASSTPLLINSVVFQNKLFFGANTTAAGFELWTTDGTSANTVLFKDINPGSESSTPFFFLDAGAVSNAFTNTSSNNFVFQDFYTVYNGRLYFVADDGTNGNEVWSTDGTAANTVMVANINTTAGGDGADQGLAYYTTTGIYFTGNNGTSGNEPWKTDGTEGGTSPVADINTGAPSSEPNYLFIYNNQLYFTASNGGDETDLYKINGQLTTLPVSLLSFAATLQTGAVLLNWSAANETNTSRYAVERSTDGIHFSTIGTVAAAGNSAAANNYLFTDAGAMQTGATVLYYRLQTAEKDGRFSRSAVLTVTLQQGTFTVKLSPNPAHEILTVSFATPGAGKTTLRITDANGRQVFQQAFQSAGATTMQQSINVAGYANGTYFIQLISNKETKTLKFIKQ